MRTGRLVGGGIRTAGLGIKAAGRQHPTLPLSIVAKPPIPPKSEKRTALTLPELRNPDPELTVAPLRIPIKPERRVSPAPVTQPVIPPTTKETKHATKHAKSLTPSTSPDIAPKTNRIRTFWKSIERKISPNISLSWIIPPHPDINISPNGEYHSHVFDEPPALRGRDKKNTKNTQPSSTTTPQPKIDKASISAPTLIDSTYLNGPHPELIPLGRFDQPTIPSTIPPKPLPTSKPFSVSFLSTEIHKKTLEQNFRLLSGNPEAPYFLVRNKNNRLHIVENNNGSYYLSTPVNSKNTRHTDYVKHAFNIDIPAMLQPREDRSIIYEEVGRFTARHITIREGDEINRLTDHLIYHPRTGYIFLTQGDKISTYPAHSYALEEDFFSAARRQYGKETADILRGEKQPDLLLRQEQHHDQRRKLFLEKDDRLKKIAQKFAEQFISDQVSDMLRKN